MLLLLGCATPAGAPSAGEIDSPPGDSSPSPAQELPSDSGPSYTPCDDAPRAWINEVVAANHEGATDEDGDTSDWIEIAAAEEVDLAGWTLSEDGESGWAFPPVRAGPGRLISVFASGKDRAAAGEELHASFSLAAAGQELFLHMPGGCVVEVVELPRLYADMSAGRRLDDGAWGMFMEPTFGAANTTEWRARMADTPALDPAPGFHDPGLQVTAVAEAGAVLRYTLDGSPPGEDDDVVEGAISLAAEAQLVPLRVTAFVDGAWPSRPATGTYGERTEALDPGLMVIALTVDPPDLFDPVTGIYEYGPDYELNYPYFGANFWEVVEREVHVEVFEPDGSLEVAQDAGIQIAGGWSRAFAQRNFELNARGGYGPESWDHRFWPDEDSESFPRLYLRNGGDWCGTQLVDGVTQALVRGDDGARLPAVDAQAYRPVQVYINGAYWGLYELKERLDESYAANHHGADPEDLDRIKLGWTHDANWEAEQGDWVAFDELESIVVGADLSNDVTWAEVEARVDLVNLAASLVAEEWIVNQDFWGNNLRLWRPRTAEGRWRWMVYDFGHGWGDPQAPHLAWTVGNSSKGLRVADFMENEAFRVIMANAQADLLNTTMRPERASAVVEALAEAVRPAMPMQRERWCGGSSTAGFESAVDYAVYFATERHQRMLRDMRTYLGDGVETVALELEASPRAGGSFQLSVVEVEAPFSGDYLRGTPVTVTAVPAEGYRFVGWEGAASGDAATVVLPMDGATELKGTFSR